MPQFGSVIQTFNPSGLRLGTPGITSRGMTEQQMRQIAEFITRVIKNQEVKQVRGEVKKLCQKFPIKKSY